MLGFWMQPTLEFSLCPMLGVGIWPGILDMAGAGNWDMADAGIWDVADAGIWDTWADTEILASS